MWFRRKDTTPLVADLRGLPTHECICGSNVFKIIACFEDYEIILYGLNAGGKTAPVEGSFQILSSSEESAKVTMGSLLSSMSFAWHPGDGEWRGPGAEKLALPVAAGAAVPIFVRWAPTASQELGQLKMTGEDCPPLKADLKGVP